MSSEDKGVRGTSIIALAGRRIDAPGTVPARFPLGTVPKVRLRLANLLVQEHAVALVCSAACGADLIALEEAERLNLRRRIVLPFPPARFRETSVVDRPGDWGASFDRLIEAAAATGDLILAIDRGVDAEAAYAVANETIIQEAQGLARAASSDMPHRPIAAVVWEGAARAGTDLTAAFRDMSVSAGFEVRSISTASVYVTGADNN